MAMNYFLIERILLLVQFNILHCKFSTYSWEESDTSLNGSIVYGKNP